MDPNSLLALPSVDRARSLLHEHDRDTLAEQIELSQIPAPTHDERERAVSVRERFLRSGLADVELDEAGNVIGRLGPEYEAAGTPAPPVVVAAHLDTVFPWGTDLAVRRNGGRIHAPGIADNARGLAALIALARVLAESDVQTLAPIYFVATVGEEGLGNLRGVKHLFRDGSSLRAATAFVSLDGPGIRRIVHRAVCSRRLRITVAGPGGHSWADWDVANPVAVIGSIVAETSRLDLPSTPRTVLNATRIGGGTAINTIPSEAWLDLDLRSESAGDLERIQEVVQNSVSRCVDAANRSRRTGTPPLQATIDLIGDRPGGATPAMAPLVRAATEATRVVGAQPVLAASSTDSNVPMALGIPAVTLGAGGEGGGIHTRDEWYSNEHGPRGIVRAMLTALSVAGVRGAT